MQKRFIIFSLFALTLSSDLKAQQYKDTTLPYDFPQFWKETGRYFSVPTRWNGNDFLLIGALAVGTVGFGIAEYPAPPVVPGVNSYLPRPLYNGAIAQFGDFYGGLFTPFIFFGGFGGYSLLTGDIKARKIAYEIGQSCLYAGAIVTTLKVVIGRARPYAGLGKTSFFHFSLTDDSYHSFPSGHCTEAFAMSTVLAFNVEPIWLKVLCFAPVPFTVFSRAYQGYHWLSDCVFGAGIGFFTAKWCADAHGRIDDAGSSQQKSNIEMKSLWPLTLAYHF